MLTYIFTDINGKNDILKYPLSVSFVSADDVPADSLTAVFAVSGNIPPLVSVIVENGNERVFNGLIDTQTEQQKSDGIILTVTARSLECILLDNEALPQTYCMPSMPLIVERHLKPLGFDKFIGPEKSFSGEMTVTKGMSEWSVLEMFCKRFLETKPKIDCFGIIDISGRKNDETIYISDNGENRCISKKHIRKRSNLISDIVARTYISGGYEMPLENPFAQKLGVKRRRYVNSIDSESRSVLSAEKILKKSADSYEQFILECNGCILCSVGASVILENCPKKLTVREVQYILNSDGEKTRLYTEVQN